MIKSLAISLVFLGSVAAQAATYTSIGWGRDGATAKPIPSKDSIQMAAEVYRALGGTSDKLTFETDEFSIEADPEGISIIILNNVENIQLSKNANSHIDARIQGPIAQFLYEHITTSAMSTVGASNKKAGNVVCSKALQSGGKAGFQCALYDVMASQLSSQE